MEKEQINAQAGPDGILPLSVIQDTIRARKARDARMAVAQNYAVSDTGPYKPDREALADMHDQDPTDPAD